MNDLNNQINYKNDIVDSLLYDIIKINVNDHYIDYIKNELPKLFPDTKRHDDIIKDLNVLRDFLLGEELSEDDMQNIPYLMEEWEHIIYISEKNIEFFNNLVKKYPNAESVLEETALKYFRKNRSARFANSDTPKFIHKDRLADTHIDYINSLREILYFWIFGISMDRKYKFIY